MTMPRLMPVAALLMSGMLVSAASANAQNAVYRVEKDCAKRERCFSSVQAALAAASSGEGWITIKIGAGDFKEKVTVSRAKTVLQGKGAGRTRLVFDAVAQTAGQFHRANWGTPGSATLTINADQVTVKALTVENSFDYLSNDALPEGDPRKISASQAVALLLDIQSDRVLIENAALLGYQDTLFANGKRAYIRKSLVAGNVDFIFGNGQVLIEDSEIRTRRRGAALPSGEIESFITAPSTPLSQGIGIVIYRSKLTREAGVKDHAVTLGRPWHPTARFPDGRYADPNAVGQASFIDCFMDAHINADHWSSMAGTARDGSKTAIFRPQDSRFSESGSYGPGAVKNDIGIKWTSPLSIAEVRHVMFEGWAKPR